MMPVGADHLTLERAEQWLTHPGQAHFAIAGAKRHCFECSFWLPEYKNSSRAICGKAAQLLHNQTPRKIPRNATICKYFEARGASVDDLG
jgi:hypothetical protein